jgi:hypothetical protein
MVCSYCVTAVHHHNLTEASEKQAMPLPPHSVTPHVPCHQKALLNDGVSALTCKNFMYLGTRSPMARCARQAPLKAQQQTQSSKQHRQQVMFGAHHPELVPG